MLVFMNKFLNLIAPADKILQSVEIGFREAVPVIQSVTAAVSSLRSTESFDSFWNESEKLLQETLEAQKSEIEARPRRQISRPSSLSDFLITDSIGERNFDFKIEIT